MIYLVTLRNVETGEVREYETEAPTALEANRNMQQAGWVTVNVRPVLWNHR